MSLDAAARAVLARLADILIPAGGGFPSASEAGVAGEGLDLVLAARPDLREGLARILLAAQGRDPAAAVSDLKSSDPAGFGVLAEVVPAAYFLNPSVQAALGYRGQEPRPIEERADYLEDGLLQSVIDRGAIYRPTP